MKKQVEAYIEWANDNPKPIKWQFTNKDARIKHKTKTTVSVNLNFMSH